jgi:twinkle protein
MEWCAARGISTEAIARHHVTLQRIYMPQVNSEVDCIAFPYIRDGEVVNIKYRSLEGKHFRQVKDAEKIFGGIDTVTGDWAVIVEGEWDLLACNTAGIDPVMSVPDGAPPANSKSSEKKFEYLGNCEEKLSTLTKIILAVDNDPPGETLEAELARRLGRERCWSVTWPNDCKDANDVLLKHGAERIRECIANAKPWPVEHAIELPDLLPNLIHLRRVGAVSGMKTGWQSVDTYYTVFPELTVVTGRPGEGKSEWLDNLILNLIRLHQWPFLVISPENMPPENHLAKYCEKFLRKPFFNSEEYELEDATLTLAEHLHFLCPTEEMTIADVLSSAKLYVLRYGIKGLVLDPWNTFDHRRPSGMTETEYVSSTLGQLHRFTRIHGIALWVVAHPAKMNRNASGEYDTVRPYDISGSAHWYNKCDNCLTVERNKMAGPEDEDYRITTLCIQKIRNKYAGTESKIRLFYEKSYGGYRDISPGGE